MTARKTQRRRLTDQELTAKVLEEMDPFSRSLGDISPGRSGLRRFHQAVVARCLAVGLKLPREKWQLAQAHAELGPRSHFYRNRNVLLFEIEWLLRAIDDALEGTGWRFMVHNNGQWGFWPVVPRSASEAAEPVVPFGQEMQCPFCDAPRGSPCVTRRSGKPLDVVTHVARDYAYVDALAAGQFKGPETWRIPQ